MRYSGPPRPREDGRCWGDGTPIIEGTFPERWGTHPSDRWVRLMLVYASEGVWHVDGTLDVVDALPVSPVLADRIRAWCDAYDHIEHTLGKEVIHPETHPDFPFDALDAEGAATEAMRRIARLDDLSSILLAADPV